MFGKCGDAVRSKSNILNSINSLINLQDMELLLRVETIKLLQACFKVTG